MAPIHDWLAAAEWLQLELLGRLVLAAVLGGVIGLERELSGKPAGFRTNLLICVGAALFTHLSVEIARDNQPLLASADPTRIAAQIVSGIGFLGAGTIIQSRGSILGLTSAATIWVVAAIGAAVGAGGYVEALGTTVLVMVALLLLGRVERHFLRTHPSSRTIRVEMLAQPGLVGEVETVLGTSGLSVGEASVAKSPDGFSASFVATGPRRAWEQTMSRLLELPGVMSASKE